MVEFPKFQQANPGKLIRSKNGQILDLGDKLRTIANLAEDGSGASDLATIHKIARTAVFEYERENGFEK